MAPTFANHQRSQEVSSLDRVRRTPAKADYERPAESHGVPDGPLAGLGGCVEVALVKVFGSKKAAAIELEKDRSQLRRQCELGTLMIRELDKPEVLAELGAVLTETYGPMRKTKKQIAREQIPQLLALMLNALEGE